MSARLKRPRHLSIESLESRNMLSVSPLVTATVVNGGLQLQGNAQNCELQVTENAQGQFIITGFDGTNIKFGNSTATVETVTGVKSGINVSLPGGGGLQRFGITNANVQGNLVVTIGAGGVQLGVGLFPAAVIPPGAVTIRGNLDITTGGGGTNLLEEATTVLQNEDLDLGAGTRGIYLDQDNLAAVLVTKNFDIDAIGAGSTLIQVGSPQVSVPAELTVGHNLEINIQAGTLDARLQNMIVGNNLNINARAGADTITVTAATVAQSATINTGIGADFVELNGFKASSLTVSLGANSDVLELFSVTTTVATNLDGESGANSLSYFSGGNSLALLHFVNFKFIS
jgi:hypothetical protein